MSSIITINKRICINPEFLGKTLNKNIFDFLKEITKNECTRDNGYIIDVKKLNKIKNNYISGNNCELIFEVEILVEILKPEINKIFKDRVCMIFSGGIFIDVKGKFKVLIPLSSLENFVFNQEKKNFTNTKTSLVIKESDLIDVKITGVKFSKKNFSCFGEFLK